MESKTLTVEAESTARNKISLGVAIDQAINKILSDNEAKLVSVVNHAGEITSGGFGRSVFTVLFESKKKAKE